MVIWDWFAVVYIYGYIYDDDDGFEQTHARSYSLEIPISLCILLLNKHKTRSLVMLDLYSSANRNMKLFLHTTVLNILCICVAPILRRRRRIISAQQMCEPYVFFFY